MFRGKRIESTSLTCDGSLARNSTPPGPLFQIRILPLLETIDTKYPLRRELLYGAGETSRVHRGCSPHRGSGGSVSCGGNFFCGTLLTPCKLQCVQGVLTTLTAGTAHPEGSVLPRIIPLADLH